MTVVDHVRHAGDRLRPIRVTLLSENQQPVQLRATDNVPPDVTLQIRRSGVATWQVPEHDCVVEEVQSDIATNGRVAYYPQADDFDVPGIYETLFHFTWQGGEPEHFPREGFYLVEVWPS